jgi:hypothetical protein
VLTDNRYPHIQILDCPHIQIAVDNMKDVLNRAIHTTNSTNGYEDASKMALALLERGLIGPNYEIQELLLLLWAC